MNKSKNTNSVRCLFCPKEINPENQTKEHIILASFGGKLWSKEILCRQCNSKFGSTIDKELFLQMEFASVYLGFSNNSLKMQTKGGEIVVAGKGLVPYDRGTFFIPNDKKEVHFWESDNEVLIRKLKKNLKGVKDKYPEFSLSINEYKNENAGKQFFFSQKNCFSPGHIFFGGDGYFRAICKMSLEYAFHEGVRREVLLNAIGMVNGVNNIPVNFYYPTNYNLRERTNDDISHLLYIKGDRNKKLLYVYSELFSFANHLCILSSEYDDNNFERLYHFDALNNREIGNSVIRVKVTEAFRYNSEAILKSMSSNNQQQQQYAFQRLIKQFEERQMTIKSK